ncbi:MAG: isopeptide-forming domain-containing fimbrial protein [Lachnospiraceae bacterium]|nr:isopeptide-forming domain-containing fimbrial protein [Lachnospiraceae bacterium]
MKKKLMSRILAGALAAALTLTSMIPAFAANGSETANLANSNIIDTSKTGILTITKYDMTAAEIAGDYDAGDTSRATGEQDTALESKLSDYAMEGVVFTYLKAGDIEQYSYTDSVTGETTLKVVYEIPTGLAAILGLDDAEDSLGDGTANDAVDMTADGVAEKCTTAGVLHYTSDQINTALAELLAGGTAGKNALEDYVNGNGGTAMAETDTYGQTTKSDLSLGLYLIVETSVPENVTDTVNPFFVSVPMTNLQADGSQTEGGEYWLYSLYVYPKNETGNPTLDKMVRNATGNAADTAGNSEDMSNIVTNLEDEYATYGTLTDQNGDILVNETDFALRRGDGTYTAGDAVGEYQYASTTTASAGDVLDYILVSNLPHITSNATTLRQYSFEDVLSAGLTYNGDMKIAFYESATDANINNTENAEKIWTISGVAGTDCFSVTSNTDVNGVTTLTVTMTEAGLNEINGVDANGDTVPANSYSDMYMVVYYSATVNADDTTVLGDNGNTNEVTLTWARTSSGYTDTLEDKSVVYVYGIDLTKQFADGSTDFADVEFLLYNLTDGYYVKATETSSGSGIYYVDGKTTDVAEAAIFTPNSNGYCKVLGLEGDSYSLTETKTADGYNLLDGEMVIVINAKSQSIQAAIAGYTGADGQQTGKTEMSVLSTTAAAVSVDGETSTLVESNGSEHALVKLLVVNTQAFVLPITGGAGLYAVTIIGVIAIAAGLFFFFGHKNQKKEEQVR